MAVDLAHQIKAKGSRRKSFSADMPIIPASYEKELARIYLKVLKVWIDSAIKEVTEQYAMTLPEMRTDSVSSVTSVLQSLDRRAVSAIITFTNEWQGWANRLTQYHYRRFITKLKYATGIDLSTQIGVMGNQSTIEALLQRNVSLVTNVSDQIRQRIADAVFSGLQSRKPVKEIAAEIRKATGLGADRARRIASDQTVKTASALDEERMRQVGANGYEWVHSRKAHPREEHKARDGQYFEFGSEVDRTDPPGYAPFCGCKRRLKLEL